MNVDVTSRDLDAEFLADVADQPAAIHIVELIPGRVVSRAVWADTIRQAALAFQLAPDQILSTPYGIPPLPCPPQPDGDGTGRVYPGTPRHVAVHPVFWLPPAVAAQRRSEDLDVWAVRLYLELVDRGAWDLEAERPIDPFTLDGLDPTNPLLIEDLDDYLRGEPVEWLTKFALPPNPQATSAEIAGAAQRVVDACRPVYQRMQRDSSEQARDLAAGHGAEVRDESLDRGVWVELRHAGVALQQCPGDPTAEAALKAMVKRATGDLARLDDSRLLLCQAVTAGTSGHADVDAAAIVDALRTAAHARQERVDRLVGAVINQPDDVTLGELWRELTGMHKQLVDEARSAADQLGRLDRAADDAGVPRGLPAGSG